MTDLSVSLRCSAFTRANDVDPVGTAGSYDVFVLVEHPQPWPREVTDDPVLAAVAAAAAKAAPDVRVRVQALVPETSAAERTCIVHVRPPGPFVGYERREGRATDDRLPSLVTELITAGAPAPGVDVLVCTHGARDVCCGSLGTRLWQEMKGFDHVRLWRTSHTGGHRFAPTAIELPAGQYWAYLDDELLTGIVDRTVTPEQVAGHYRGCAAFASPAMQAAERFAFARHGWAWLDCKRTASEPSPGTVRIDYEAPDGACGAYEADVVVTRDLPVPDCGRPIEEAKKSEAELAVVRFEPVP